MRQNGAFEIPIHIREVQPLLVPYPDELMEAYPVGPAVGNVRNDGPELILPVA
jgi:putative SOS response-associated peptidase YedK